MKKQFYFHSSVLNSDIESCYTEQHFQDYMKKNGLTEIEVYPAKRQYGSDFFYCKKVFEVCEKGQNTCRECEDYQPLNGVKGVCKYNKPVYEPSDNPIILKLKQ
jgi:hypothetical protein